MAGRKKTWKDVKAVLVAKDKTELLKLIADLYALSAANKSFIHSRYSIDEDILKPYKNIITESLYPEIEKDEDLDLAAGRKAISDYFKATKDRVGQLELMVHYLESGNRFTLDYGDIDERFYSSLESMFEKIVSSLREQPPEMRENYHSRLKDVVVSARNMGWGYYDGISALFREYQAEVDDEFIP